MGFKEKVSQFERLNITTVIPVYLDSGLPLEVFGKTVSSVLNQSSPPYEIVISDDSSCSRVEDYLASLEVPSAISIRYFRNPGKKGVSSNSNFGAQQAKSSLIHFLHADDLLVDPHTYQSCDEIFRDASVKWLLLSGQTNGVVTIPEIRQMSLFGVNSIGGPSSIVIRKSCFDGFDEKLSMIMDVEFVDRTEKFLGSPSVSSEVSIEYGVGAWQIQQTIGSNKIKEELIYLVNLARLDKSDLRKLMSYEGMWEIKRMALSTLRITSRINLYYFTVYQLFLFKQILRLYFDNFKARIGRIR